MPKIFFIIAAQISDQTAVFSSRRGVSWSVLGRFWYKAMQGLGRSLPPGSLPTPSLDQPHRLRLVPAGQKVFARA